MPLSILNPREKPQKTSDSLDNLRVEETNVDGAPELLSNEFLVVDTRFDSKKMNVGFEASTVTIAMNVGFDGQYGHDGHGKRFCLARVKRPTQ